MEEEKKPGLFDVKLRLIWVIIIVAVVAIAAIIAIILSQKKETVLENHTVSLEDQRSLIEKAEERIVDYYDTYLKQVIDNKEYEEIAVSMLSFEDLDKMRDDMAKVYQKESPEYNQFIHQYDKLQHKYFLEFKDLVNEYCKSYVEEYHAGRISKKEFERLNKLRDKHLKK